MRIIRKLQSTIAVGIVLAGMLFARAQGTIFTYQGTLNSGGSAANGLFDLQFTVLDSVFNPVGLPLTNAATPVSNGVFTMQLDFGSNIFDGSSRLLSIGVRTNGSSNPFTILSPNQPITATPYAIKSAGAVKADSVLSSNIFGGIADAQLSTNVALLNGSVNFSGSVSAGNFAGSGLGLSNVTAGALADAPSLGTVPFQTNVYSPSGTYSFTVPSNTTKMVVKLWGAGGAGGYTSVLGGGGAFVMVTLNVTPGDTYYAVVGSAGMGFCPTCAGVGGNDGAGGLGTTSGGEGGQASSLFKFTGSGYIMRAVAGGGGGGGASGGGPGGNPGANGGSISSRVGGGGGYNGIGGTATSPGQPGTNYSINAITIGETSLNLMGGDGGTADQSTSGGGGGGYGGGGGGKGSGGGGGGGSYGDVVIAGNGASPGNYTDPNFPGGGYGSSDWSLAGGDGSVVVIFRQTGTAFSGVINATALAGNGSNVTSLNASNLTSGTVPLALLPAAVVTNNATGVTLSGTFNGNGAGLTSLNASALSSGAVPLAQIPGTVVLNNSSGINLSGTFKIWQTFSGTSLAAQANTGYLLTNNAQISVTLPASPNLGDIVRIAGIGSNGWLLLQNAGQQVVSQGVGNDFNHAWVARDSVRVWTGVASSADGNTLFATVNGGVIYRSFDAGATWNPTTTPVTNWVSIACSADGSKVAALGNFGLIYTSVDSGGNWILRTGVLPFSSYWMNVASSSDGLKLAAVAQDESAYTSVNAGTNWGAHAVTASPPTLMAVCSSADGTKLAAATYYQNKIFTSVDLGSNWTAQTTVVENRVAITCSSDGSRILSGGFTGPLDESADTGATWINPASLASAYWVAFASSASGLRQVAAVSGGPIYITPDGGLNWVAQNSGNRNWSHMACSSDGTKIVVTVGSGQIYTYATGTTTGVTGQLQGSAFSAIELLYVGNGQWSPLSHEGTIQSF